MKDRARIGYSMKDKVVVVYGRPCCWPILSFLESELEGYLLPAGSLSLL